MSAFKVYVVKEYVGNAVFEREIEIALKEELDAERAGTPPDLSKAVTTKQLVKALNKDKTLGRIYRQTAAEHGAMIYPAKKSLVETVKGWFA